MSLHRFFVDTPIAGGRLEITGDDLHHLRDVLRLDRGAEVVVADRSGSQAVSRIVAISEEEATLEVVRALPVAVLPDVTLVQGLARGPKMDLVVQKATEVGVRRIVPVAMARSVARADAAATASKAARWRRIAEEAAKQSQRAEVPEVSAPIAFEELAGVLAESDVVLVPWEESAGPGIRDALETAGATERSRVAVVVGPEGGMERAEVERLEALGAVTVSLGATILRAETAAIVAVSLVCYELGGLGGSPAVNRRVAFRTLGCKVNQAESEAVAASLTGTGWELADEREAGVVVINTCTVTSEADRKARKEVRRALRLPGAPAVVVTGCLAAVDPDGLASLSSRVVVEADKDALAATVASLAGTASPERTVVPGGARDGLRTRVAVKVEDGCDAHCAYCIVPRARGVPRSVPVRDVVAAVEALVERGTAEVVLTGVNLGRYRDADYDLASLVRAVASTGVSRLRLSSVEPLDLPGGLLEALAATPVAVPHLHVPLQAGCDRVLGAMGRHYGTADYAAVLAQARAALPGLAVSTDVMAGFPGETAAEAEATRAFVEECGFMRLHVFRFSLRPGTRAAGMAAQVDPRDAAVRARLLRDAGERLAENYARSRVGGDVSVLVERVSDGTATGTSADYLKVRFPAQGCHVGEIVELRVMGNEGGEVVGAW